MASARQIHVGGVPIGGGAPVAVQTMTKTETANLGPTMDQIRRVAEAGADIVRVAVPREQDVEALKTIVRESPIPVIADIHFNHTLAIKAIEAGAHCVRINPGNIGGPEKVAEVVAVAKRHGTPLRVGVNSGSLPKHLRDLEFTNPVEALVTAATEWVELMERLDFHDFKVSMKSTSVPNTIASNRLLAEKIDHPLHLGVTEAGTKWSGSLKSAVGLGTLLADGIGDTIRISPLDLPRRGGGQGRLGDPQGAQAARARPGAHRLPDLRAPAVRHGLGRRRGRAAPGGLRRPDRGLDPRLRRQRHRRGAPRRLRHHRRQGHGDDLLAAASRCGRSRPSTSSTSSSPRSTATTPRGKKVVRDDAQAAEAAAWLAENEDATAMTPERLAALEAEAARLDEEDSPVAGRRFTRA